MAHPKRKISKTRRDKRRTHDKATAHNVSKCSNCGAPILHHRVCGECGFYMGKEAVSQEVAAQ
jgi:large subunit ribosomal protein L32